MRQYDRTNANVLYELFGYFGYGGGRAAESCNNVEYMYLYVCMYVCMHIQFNRGRPCLTIPPCHLVEISLLA